MEQGQGQLNTRRLNRLDLYLSIPSLIVGTLFAAWAIFLYIYFDGINIKSRDGCPISTLFSLLLINGLLDFVLRIMTFGGKLGRFVRMRRSSRGGSSGGHTGNFAAFWVFLELARSVADCISFVLILVWILLLFTSGACVKIYPTEYANIRAYIFTLLAVNLVATCVSCFCVSMERMSRRRTVLLIEPVPGESAPVQEEPQGYRVPRSSSQSFSSHQQREAHEQEQQRMLGPSAPSGGRWGDQYVPMVIIHHPDGTQYRLPVRRDHAPGTFDQTVSQMMGAQPHQPYRMRHMQVRSPFANLMNVLLGPSDENYLMPPTVMVRDQRGRLRAAPRDLLDQMITEIALNYEGPSGAPPAPESAIRSLSRKVVNEEDIQEEGTCPICLDEYEVGDETTHMPCDHFFHTECIVPWLQRHNNCPICRREISTNNRRNDGSNRSSRG